jgi:hypothetical protein
MNRDELRDVLKRLLGIPEERCPLLPESRGKLDMGEIVVEKLIFSSEPGLRVPAVLYRPRKTAEPGPAIVLTCGHAGSKSQPYYAYAGQLYARLGVICLVLDPIGEEERHITGEMGTRAHDPAEVVFRAEAAGRSIMGKLVFDTMRGLDYLCGRSDVNPNLLGVMGNSLGGEKASFISALDPRPRMVIACGMSFWDGKVRAGHLCHRTAAFKLRACCTWAEYLSLAPTHGALMLMLGEKDEVASCCSPGDLAAIPRTRVALEEARRLHEDAGGDPRAIVFWSEPGGGHRPYPLHPVAVQWVHRHLGTPGWTLEQLKNLPTIKFGTWCDQYGITWEPFYFTELHHRGATTLDLGIAHLTRDQLACLRPNETGDPQYTLEGWLQKVERGFRPPEWVTENDG